MTPRQTRVPLHLACRQRPHPTNPVPRGGQEPSRWTSGEGNVSDFGRRGRQGGCQVSRRLPFAARHLVTQKTTQILLDLLSTSVRHRWTGAVSGTGPCGDHRVDLQPSTFSKKQQNNCRIV